MVLSPPVREKDDKYKTWMPKFLIPKEDKDQRKSSMDVERSWFLFCVFPCCLALYKHLLSRCRSRKPLIAQAFCALLLLLRSLFPLKPAFRKLCRHLEDKTNSWPSCVQVRDTLRVSGWSCIVFPLSWEKKKKDVTCYKFGFFSALISPIPSLIVPWLNIWSLWNSYWYCGESTVLRSPAHRWVMVCVFPLLLL